MWKTPKNNEENIAAFVILYLKWLYISRSKKSDKSNPQQIDVSKTVASGVSIIAIKQFLKKLFLKYLEQF